MVLGDSLWNGDRQCFHVIVEVLGEHDFFRPLSPFSGRDDLQLLALGPGEGLEAHVNRPLMCLLDVLGLRQDEAAVRCQHLCDQSVRFRLGRQDVFRWGVLPRPSCFGDRRAPGGTAAGDVNQSSSLECPRNDPVLVPA